MNTSKRRDPRFWERWRKSGSIQSLEFGMSTDGPTPPPCNSDIFQHGSGVCVVDGSSNAVERWVRSVAKKANAQVDWHYSGGRANVLHLGDDESRQRVLKAIGELEGNLKGTIISLDDPALYRKGVEDPGATGAVLRKVGDQLVMDDPEALALIRAVEKRNCRNTLVFNADRVEHFKNRLKERGMTADKAVIVLLNVDDVHGGPLADALMPGHNWQEFRDRGEVPFARGLASRDGIQGVLSTFDKEAAEKLKGTNGVAVVVVDHGVAEVFAASLVPTDVEKMSDREILEHLSDMNMLHMMQHEQIEYYLEWYFKSYDATPSGRTAAMVKRMTAFQKIGVLEEIAYQDNADKLPSGLWREIDDLVRGINKEGFRTAHDYYSGSVCVMCKCGKDFNVANIADALPTHDQKDGTFCTSSGCIGVCEISPR